MIELRPYKKTDQNGIDELINEIANEFELPITNRSQSISISLDKHWVVFNEAEVIGTIGVLNIDNAYSILKNMFVKKEFRGKRYGIAQLLLNEVYEWCCAENLSCIYLGTMNQFKAAQKFYVKNNFEEITKNCLPVNFVANPIDDVFYKKSL